ncbi:hypothetical protein RND81_08G062000 [Saponaria officinalis]|uniref:C3H1-type domain-containing protein n=1 Tax=Saponaria officinalis TaxID=3572 RepID=A0AAW1J3W8_SAPOF
MGSSEPFSQFVPISEGVDSLGFWPQFPVSNEQSDVNSQFDYDPPSKRAKNSVENQPMNHHHHNNNSHRSPPNNPPVNQPTGRIFFKTRLCVKFRMGQCRNGENCNFAHGDEDLRKPPPNWQDLVSGRTDDRGISNSSSNNNGNGYENWGEDDDRIIHKMKLCKKYYNGEECPYGERCNFLHKDPPKFRDAAPPPRFRESSSTRESSAISIGTTGPPVGAPRAPEPFEGNRNAVSSNASVDASRGNSRPVYWKTRRCMKFETTGFCPFGDTCHYAHGQAELLLPGGRPADSEPTLGSSAPLKAVPPATDPTPMKTENVFPTNEGQSKKSLLKWNSTKKINRIYGDWIDDLDLPSEK